jgi:hypothetical protein
MVGIELLRNGVELVSSFSQRPFERWVVSVGDLRAELALRLRKQLAKLAGLLIV